MQVVRWRAIHFLRDGTHRAFGLLSRGIPTAPVLFREFADHQNPGIQVGPHFPLDTLLSAHPPPLLTDLLDDRVCANIFVRKLQKTFTFRAFEQDMPIL